MAKVTASNPSGYTLKGFLKAFAKGLATNWIVWVLALIVASIAYRARPVEQTRNADGSMNQDWMAWGIRVAGSLAGVFIIGRYLPKVISRSQAIQTAITASFILAAYGHLRGFILALPVIGTIAGYGERLGGMIAEKTGSGGAAVDASLYANPPFVPGGSQQGIMGNRNANHLRAVKGVGDGQRVNRARRLFAA